MQGTDSSKDLSESYFLMLNALPSDKKLRLAVRLIESVRFPESKLSFASFYGAWDSDKSAEEIIAEIEGSRTSTLDREPL